MSRQSAPVSISFPLFLIILATQLSSPLAQVTEGEYPAEPHGPLIQWGQFGTANGEFKYPQGIAVNSEGNVYVADRDNDRIQVFHPDGSFWFSWGESGTGNGQFDGPCGVAISEPGWVYVADTGNNRIQKFDSEGTFVEITSDNVSCLLNEPRGLSAIDGPSNGWITVADSGSHTIVQIEWSQPVSPPKDWSCEVIGEYGTSDGQFNSPYAVAQDTEDLNSLFVADRLNQRVQRRKNAMWEIWGVWGTGEGEFASPRAVVKSENYVYVADTANHRIQKFDSEGNYITQWGSSGTGVGEFAYPSGIAVAPSGDIYVSDTNNHRIQKFGPSRYLELTGSNPLLYVAGRDQTTAVRTLFLLENNGAPRFAFQNSSSDVEWSFQQSGPGNFLISKEGTGGPEMQVYQDGRIRMGPGGARNLELTPAGNLKIKGSLTANGSVFPDYVFDPDYPLMPLSYLETFIQREHSLPDIPSAEKIQQQGGHNMTELQLKLLRKIEELTLYILELNGQIHQDRTRIGQLEAKLLETEATEKRLEGDTATEQSSKPN